MLMNYLLQQLLHLLPLYMFIITESLKTKVLPHIVNDFASALKSLKAGESIRFGKLGTFKKSQRTVNGYTGYQYSFKAHSLVKK
jgi:nucleoid DNA-binding protein